MRLIEIALCGVLLAAGSGCMDGREEASRTICPFLAEVRGIDKGLQTERPLQGRGTAKDWKGVCPFAGRLSTQRKCPRRSAATLRRPRDGRGAGKGMCPFVADEESNRGSSSGAQTMEL